MVISLPHRPPVDVHVTEQRRRSERWWVLEFREVTGRTCISCNAQPALDGEMVCASCYVK